MFNQRVKAISVVLVVALFILYGASAGAEDSSHWYEDKIYIPVVLGDEDSSTSAPEPTATAVSYRPTNTPEPNRTSTPRPSATLEPTSTPWPTATATPEPTSTPLPSATPEPTSTPLPTATPTPDKPTVFTRSNHSYWDSPYSGLWIFGEVTNNSNDRVRQIKVPVDLYDQYGTFIATTTGYTEISDLSPGETGCFLAYFDNPGGWGAYRLYHPNYDIETGSQYSWDRYEDPRPSITITSHNATWDGYSWTISGWLRNDDDEPVDRPKARVTVYDSADNVVGCATGYASDDTLLPNQSSNWEASYLIGDDSKFSKYKLQGDGRYQ